MTPRLLLATALLASCARNDGGTADNRGLEGDECSLDASCGDGLSCASDGTCQPTGSPGTFRSGAACPGSDWCALGLVCDHDGLCTRDDAPGTAAWGASCAADSTCRAGLSCVEGACAGFEVPVWRGVSCPEAPSDAEPLTARMRIPRDEPSERYYDLPFPSDLRLRAGGLDVSGMAEPGPLPEPLGDPVGDLLDLSATASGFAASTSIFFQLTHTPDWDTATAGDGGSMHVVDLTPGPTFGDSHPVTMTGSPGRRQYICANWLALTPVAGRPFRAGHTYGAYLTRSIQRESDGTPLQPDTDLTTVLAVAPPTETALQEAWELYAPLRDWLGASAIPSDSLGAATVFTVHDPLAPLLELIDAVDAAPRPEVADLHTCTGTPGPWDDGAGRGCGPLSPTYTEVHGALALPSFQSGTAPFRTPDDGGHVEGRPRLEAVEPVPFVLTVPAGEMPEEGWPLVIHAHGSADDSRRVVRGGLAERWAAIDYDARTRVSFAVLSLDFVHHGDRLAPAPETWLTIDPRGGDSSRLQLNRTNARAFRGNGLQAIADLAAAARWASDQVWAGGDSPTGRPLRFDASHIVASGHDTGAWVATAWTVADPLPTSLVLASTAGSLPTMIAESEHPFDLGQISQVAFADTELDRDQVLLSMEAIQFDPIDPMNSYEFVHREPLLAPRHVLQVIGRGGSVDEQLQEAAARPLYTRQLANGVTPVPGLAEASDEIRPNPSGITAATILSDRGEDALFADADIARQVDAFLASGVIDDAPTVPR